MKCRVCGTESGRYPLCRACNAKKETGTIIKCENCGNWHYAAHPCPVPSLQSDKYLYEPKTALISKSEQSFFNAIQTSIPEGYYVFPQINLASFIDRTDDARYHNELFRNVDFLVTDSAYRPLIIIEINDQTHLTAERKERDEKVKRICDEAGIPIIKLWTSYGVNPEYIKSKLTETLASLPVARIHHFSDTTVSVESPSSSATATTPPSNKQGGCYIATCVYGSYDCPQVWTLRRFRDFTLSRSRLGRYFISTYYSISPPLVKLFGSKRWFKNIWKKALDAFIEKLRSNGYSDTPYNDK